MKKELFMAEWQALKGKVEQECGEEPWASHLFSKMPPSFGDVPERYEARAEAGSQDSVQYKLYRQAADYAHQIYMQQIRLTVSKLCEAEPWLRKTESGGYIYGRVPEKFEHLAFIMVPNCAERQRLLGAADFARSLYTLDQKNNRAVTGTDTAQNGPKP